MHSTINKYIYYVFRGILKQNNFILAIKQMALIIRDALMMCIPV